MSGGEASAPADATPPDFCARRSSLEVFPVCSRRFPLFALSLFLALLLVPSRALAYDFIPKGLVYSADLDGSRYGAVVIAANQFDAACYALGKEPASISTSIRSKLSDPNYGGRFYDFSQAFYTQGWPLEDVPQWLPVYVWGSVEWSDLLLSDYQSVWYVTCTQSLRSGALADFLSVLNGEDLSSPSVAPVIDGQYLYFRGNPLFEDSSGYSASYYRSGGASYTLCARQTQYMPFPAPLVVRVPLSAVSGLLASYPTDSYSWFIQLSYYNGAITSCEIMIGNLSVTRGTVNGVEGIKSVSGSYTYASIPKQYFTFDYSTSTFTCTYNNSIGVSGSWSGTPKSSNISFILGTDFVSAPPAPSGTWPEPSSPAAPVEPTFPDPAAPTVQPDPVVTEPTVTWPSPTITIDPDPVPVTTPTGLDYTELLTRINDNLISIDSFARAINSNLNSLRSDLVNEFNGVVQGLRNVYTYLQHMDSVLERHCVHLQNKLEDVSVDIQNKIREMVRWLADELDFDSEVSGNSDLFGILSTISDKLGGGTYEPNPLKDENAYYEWLDDLWDRFLLGDNWQSSASSMSQSFGQLTSRFPFSVPWDIVALFRLFVHEPVTPVFDLPLYYSSEDSATVRVDLSAWDGVASVVRPLVFVIFALNLALLSRHLLAGFGADKGGL